MHVVLAADRTKLAGAEHPGHCVAFRDLCDGYRIVIGLAEEAVAAIVAGENQRGVGIDRTERLLEVGAGTIGVADLELQRSADGRLGADTKCPLSMISADDPPHEKVTAPERLGVLVDGKSHMQAIRDQGPFVVVGTVIEFLEALKGRA